MTPIVDAILALDRALSPNEGSSETHIKLAPPAYYALWKQLQMYHHEKAEPYEFNAVPGAFRVGRIYVSQQF